ncbi:hypothetical protein AB0I72_19100 [Nocardiopsis sp. NPDC049922]|uniref:hypothetical protein n=1 Tax=Nocardiopsis sp. NPDC049922 TaxID=3155157 RepID=UPI0034065F86
MELTTEAAARLADATPATIRAWCRIGAVRAVRRAGRWVISYASLARRIAIGVMVQAARARRRRTTRRTLLAERARLLHRLAAVDTQLRHTTEPRRPDTEQRGASEGAIRQASASWPELRTSHPERPARRRGGR